MPRVACRAAPWRRPALSTRSNQASVERSSRWRLTRPRSLLRRREQGRELPGRRRASVQSSSWFSWCFSFMWRCMSRVLPAHWGTMRWQSTVSRGTLRSGATNRAGRSRAPCDGDNRSDRRNRSSRRRNRRNFGRGGRSHDRRNGLEILGRRHMRTRCAACGSQKDRADNSRNRASRYLNHNLSPSHLLI